MDDRHTYVLKADGTSNGRSISTTSRWNSEKIPGRPEGRKAQAPQAASKAFQVNRLTRRDHRVPITMTVRFRGGPEAWFEIRARGRTYRVTGHDCLYDAMGLIFNGDDAGRQ